jgi:membrane protein implicated in regulation of membrane protease activity
MRMILLGMTVLPWIILLAFGVRLLLGDSPLLGFVLLALASVTLVLSVRRTRAELSPPDPDAGLSTAEFDYLTWTMFAVPMILVALLLVLLVTGGLRPT